MSTMRAAVATLFLLLAPRVARAQTHADVGCPGCELTEPAKGAKGAPLLVALHGDEGTPARMIQLWRTLATSRGYAFYAVKCPRAEGCTTGSFWRWNGPAAWLTARVAMVEGTYGTDPERRYLTTWSGGTSYAGLVAKDLGEAFTAINLNGGGLPPETPTCAACPAPVLYLSGEKNPLRGLAEDARDYLERCHVPLDWQSIPGADHEVEMRALRDRRGAILDFFDAHPARCALPSAAPAVVASAPTTPPPAPTASEVVRSPPPSARPQGCSCEVPRSNRRSDPLALVALALALGARRYRPRSRPASFRFLRASEARAHSGIESPEMTVDARVKPRAMSARSE